ncbi:putative spermidine/putrescine transport system ATP-binding protein [Halorubrum alkaliphilum]|uniref:Molybdate/tungstate import ATP-binding protein WtpC n=1 Tax=Halorubrum alkaliphilum TaxID=261290 RepID=A0A8T4GC09_9EURY|nr:ABC transporter ATP-binding protein [Halorubrum alkaliphilum]MBP1921968.1 putative spermidine/putrescine transport system ATP-binding protein [Halorubrum alkaliphilum]
MSEVTLDSLTKRYDEEVAVDGIDLTVRDGEVLGVIGPSGCGKTTTLRTIAGFETPTEGRVLFDDDDVTHVPPEDRNVGLVFQSYALFNNMSVLDNVAFGLKMQGVDKEERRDRANELLELVGIGEHAEKDPRQLSGGQQQRVGLARALAIEPRILLLDEPMTGLDAKLKKRLEEEIGSLLDELNVTTLYVTHDQEEAMVMCDRIAVLNDGRIEQIGTPAEIYERPANAFVADFVGTSNAVSATIEDGRMDLGFATYDIDDIPETAEGTAIVRPGDFRVGEGDIEGVVRDRYYLGDRVRARIELPNGDLVTVALDPSTENARTGDTVSLVLDPSGVHVLRSE